ncbi:MAG: hypothetical protein NTX22_13450 [Ignavibacteriales bacterium]|nr:hypothetical protein [Ignavibacteriales bacterium]
MKIKYVNNFLIIFFILFSSFSFAQLLDLKTAEEHQAVKDYIQRKINERAQAKNYLNVTSSAVKDGNGGKLLKTTGMKDRKNYIMNGNKILVEVTNFGGIGGGYSIEPNRILGNVVWKGLPYIFQFVPIVGASVPDAANPNKRLHIISDALDDYPHSARPNDDFIEINPTEDTLWQFQPLPGYADPNQENMAHNPDFDTDRDGKPDSWPREWYNSTLGKYVWPGYLKQDANNSDLEVFWSMDDRDNREFHYYPYNDDLKKMGIGVQVDGRALQWSNSLAENAVFFVYTITNVSNKDLDSVFFGVYGDPDIGGQKDNADDVGFFIPPNLDDPKIPLSARSMVYLKDDGNSIGEGGLPDGILACKFLESPGNPNDGIDNDGDGMIDESQFNGIDDDNDWNPETDDVGVDGISNTGDEGERDGIPTAGKLLSSGALDPLHPGEPNFEYTDLDEADQIGLTSFSTWPWGKKTGNPRNPREGYYVSNDSLMWEKCKPGSFDEVLPEGSDITFVFGSGYISLKQGESKRISMALILGDDIDDLLTTASTVQNIYDRNYNFSKPPDLPTLNAIPGDKKVTLYWDDIAEGSVDPITGKDFEGYVLYRSTDPSFSDIQTISDGKATPFLSEPLKTYAGVECKWDLVNVWNGYHPVSYKGRGIHYYLGDNTGLVHSYIDSNNVINGQTYYYALVAYDHGDSLNFPPTETTKKISVDPITSKSILDKNTALVIPGPRASGYIAPVINNSVVLHKNGSGNGIVDFSIFNDLLVDNNEYKLFFNDTLEINGIKKAKKNFSVFDSKLYSKEINFFNYKFVDVGLKNILADAYLKLKDENGKEYSRTNATDTTDFVIDLNSGKIRRSYGSSIPDNSAMKYIIQFRYLPVSSSTLMSYEDNNPVFDGINIKVTDQTKIEYDPDKSKWLKGNSNMPFSVALSSVGTVAIKMAYPADYEIQFSSSNIDSAYTTPPGKPKILIPVKYSVHDVTTGVPQIIHTFLRENNVTRDSAWSPGEEIIFYKPGLTGANSNDILTWGLKINYPPATATDTVYPGDGDILFIATKRPFTEQDTFYLTTNKGALDNSLASSNLDNIYVVPNPYVGYNALEPANKLSGQSRGERRIYFENLPSQCTIRIYTLSGDPVKEIIHDSGVINGREYWNLLNRDGFSVSYGLYIAHIDAPNIGEKIIKFALIK